MSPDSSDELFAALLHRLRRAAALTQEELAERARLSVRGINDLERGVHRAPRKDTVALLAEALALTPPDRDAFEAAARRHLLAPEAHEKPPTFAIGQPTNLPHTLTSFVGRTHAQHSIRQTLTTTRLLTLTGAGGVGKTRLALAVAASVLPAYPDGVWLVELASLADPALVGQAVASVLGVCEQQGHPLITTLAEYLRPKHLLLVLDNCEHLVAACADMSATLLGICPRVTILATSREVLGVSGEQAWRVPSLGLPDPDASPTRTEASEAVQLFIERARLVWPAFRVTSEATGLVAQICRRLDGMPLAIELAASRLASLSLDQLASRLDDCFRLLTGGSRTALPRQQTLRATLDWSYELLSVQERLLFQQLSVFSGGWTLEAAEAVCQGDGITVAEVLDLLAGLVRQSLVSIDEGADGAGGRYRLLETVRQYGHERLEASGDARKARDRHLEWCLALAEAAAAAWYGSQEGHWLRYLDAEYEGVS